MQKDEVEHFLIVHPRGTCKICDHIRLLLEFDYAMLKWHKERKNGTDI